MTRRKESADPIFVSEEGIYTFDMNGHPVDRRRRVVTNTTLEDPLRRNPNDLANRPFPRDVLSQEDRGLRELVKCDQIPRECVAKDKDVLEKMGFKLLKPTEGDSLFHDVEIPAGWQKVRAPDDSRTMYFLDAAGNQRFLVWYKAASYDRAAYGYPLRRFDVADRSFKDYTEVRVYVSDNKNNPAEKRVIHMTEIRTIGGIRELESAQAEERKKAIEWAKAQGIDLNDPCAHWDDADLPTAGTFPPWR